MKKSLILTLLLALNVFFFEPLISKEIVEDKNLIEKGLIEGIEIVNDTTFSNEALQIALDYNLTILGTSDIHGIVDWQYRIPSGGHRPVTLVFAREKTKARSVRNGLSTDAVARAGPLFYSSLLHTPSDATRGLRFSSG